MGASAGGLEAVCELLRALPEDTGMAFVLVQHLAPDRPSSLTEILGRATSMPVCEVCGDCGEPTIQANHVYVIPPGQDMKMESGGLRLVPQQLDTRRHGIDVFFTSLAEHCGHKAIGVVLSGALSDGTLGLEAIKAEGGITFAQNDSALHSSMPRSAVASGSVDFVLSPAEIGVEIARISRHPFVVPEQGHGDEADHAGVAGIIQQAMGVDFTHYKANTLHRRITRRMVLHKLESMKEYEACLEDNPAEVEALYQEILIGVTSFFRDPDAYVALAQHIFPKLLAGRSRQEPLRIWTLGCSTGEEAYSLAIVFTECAERLESSVPLQIFATDLNHLAIATARSGLYPKRIAQEVSAERLRRFFTEEEEGYRICKSIRERCIFSRHNVLGDPPFSRVDLISCRNMLIYLEPVLQQQVVPMLHYALKPEGRLWLGGSESVGASRALFDVEDLHNKIFLKRPGLGQPGMRFRLTQASRPQTPSLAVPVQRESARTDLPKEAERLLLSRYAPPGVVISASMEILQFRGDTSPYLAPMEGTASLQLLKMLREGLMVCVRAAVLRATETGHPVRDEGLRVSTENGYRELTVEVIPLQSGAQESGFLVLFIETQRVQQQPAAADASMPGDALSNEIARLTLELAATRDYLQDVIEQQEAVNEELQSANEEAQSANEELQSIVEELETSKEETQATNEELTTVNDELSSQGLELTRLNAYLRQARDFAESIVESVRWPLVVLDADLRVRSASAAFYTTFQVDRSLTEGVRIYDLGNRQWDIPDLRRLLENILPQTQAVDDFEVRHDFEKIGPRTMMLSARRLMQRASKEPLIVMAIEDITERKRAHAVLNRLAAIVETTDDAIVSKDLDGIIATWNAGAERLFGYTAAEVIGQPMTLLAPADRMAEEADILAHVREGVPVDHLETVRLHKNGTPIHVSLTVSPLRDHEGRINGASKIARDITQQKSVAAALVEKTEQLKAADRNKDEFLAMLAHELRNPLAPMRNSVEILEDTGVSDEEHTIARNILRRQISNMSRMIDDLMDVSRFTQGKINLHLNPVSLESLLTSAASLARSGCAAHKQRLSIHLPVEQMYLNADATRLEQVFGNLLSNACKYSGEGSRIFITAERDTTSSTPQVIVRVGDDGHGISPELLPHVFELFRQSSRALDRAQGGLGIGLTLVERLVAQHGGRVEAHSEGLGRGCEFIVHLPLMAEAPPPAPLPPMDAERVTTCRMLIVDDNTDSAKTLALLQKRCGHDTRTAFTGPEALVVAGDFLPQVVLLDIGLPGMSGYEVARQIRAMPALTGAFLIAMSGYGHAEDVAEARAAGFDNYLVKPVNLSELNELLRTRSRL
jgi:two-component system CheB/CheR fusion protein